MSKVTFNLFDFRIDMFHESGIYDEVVRRVFNPKNTPVFDKRLTTFTNDFENITITQMKALFFILFISFIFSFVLFLLEYFFVFYINNQQTNKVILFKKTTHLSILR